jgi:hypothetical protein
MKLALDIVGELAMEIYFGSLKPLDTDIKPHNLVTFAIPEIGVRFKAPYPAEDLALEYVSLLTLLEFVDVNPQLFRNRALELFTNNRDLVQQINNRQVNNSDLLPYLEKTLEYRSRLRFSINWVAFPDNPAQQSEIS